MENVHNEIDFNLLSFSEPTLDDKEKLYVKAYLSKLSHSYAHSVVSPGLKKYHENNPFSKRENIQYHISKDLHNRMEALSITPEVIIEKLFSEATREGKDSNHNARINALNILGKYLGMFKDKEESKVPTIHIINYSESPIETKVEKIEEEQIIMNETDDYKFELDNIEILDYGSE